MRSLILYVNDQEKQSNKIMSILTDRHALRSKTSERIEKTLNLIDLSIFLITARFGFITTTCTHGFEKIWTASCSMAKSGF